MPPIAGLHVFLSYRFSDGMIHGSLVPRYMRGVAPKYNSAWPISYLNLNPNLKYQDSSSAPEQSGPC
jgi:hypothetical protein